MAGRHLAQVRLPIRDEVFVHTFGSTAASPAFLASCIDTTDTMSELPEMSSGDEVIQNCIHLLDARKQKIGV